MTVNDDKYEDLDVVCFDTALEKTGNGLYNILLASFCSLVLMAISIDLFGFTLVVTAACDLNVNVVEKGVLTSLPFAGIILTSYPWGFISDTRGRKFTLIVSLLGGFIVSCISSLSPGWIFLGICKFIAVCFFCAAHAASYTLMGESCIERVRSRYMLLMTCFLIWATGLATILTYPTVHHHFTVLVPGIGILFKPWRLLILVLSIPAGICAVCIFFFYESPKFLVNAGKTEEALNVLKAIYAINHRCSKDDFKISSLAVPERATTQKTSLSRKIYEQSAPLFRPPYLKNTLLLFYITGVSYFTNNSILVWLPPMMNEMRRAVESGSESGNVCHLVSEHKISSTSNATIATTMMTIAPEDCVGLVKNDVLQTLLYSQTTYALLNAVVAMLSKYRRYLMISTIIASASGGIMMNLVPDPIASVFFFALFSCTCLTMGILASYFVDLYPTSHRGMAQCLSIMVGRTSAFVGINLVANLIFSHCYVTFYVWAVVVFTSAVAAWFLPSDKDANGLRL